MLIFETAHGLYRVKANGRYETATSLERLIEKLEPGAPPEKITATAEILGPHIGKGHEQISEGVASA